MTGFWLTIIASLLAFAFGITYLFRSKYMSYHHAALQKDWEELAIEVRTLILALMRAVGGGLISTAVAMVFLQLEFNKTHIGWMAWAILIIGSITFAGSLYAMLLVRLKTKGRPPIFPATFILLMIIAGFFFNLFG